MGDGFVVLQSSHVDMYYYQDEAGIVPFEPEVLQMADGDVIIQVGISPILYWANSTSTVA